MASALIVTRVDDGDEVRLTVAGEVDCGSAPRFVEPLRRAIADSVGTVHVDLGAVTFMDSSGLNALAAARDAAGARLRLGTLHPAVRRVLEITNMLELFDVTDDGDLLRRPIK
jgi:anti-sigma B factor antagonist